MPEDFTPLYRYFDAKFDAVNISQQDIKDRMTAVETLWREDSRECAAHRERLNERLSSLEKWKAFVVGGFAVVGFFLTNAPVDVWRWVFPTGAK